MTPQFNNLQPPSTDLQDVLLYIVKHNEVSLINFPMLAGFRTRISELRMKGVRFVDTPISGKNRHGHNKVMMSHKCTNPNFALNLYKQLTECGK